MSPPEPTHHRRSVSGGASDVSASDDSTSVSGNVKRRDSSCDSDYCSSSVEKEVDLESGGVSELKVVHLGKKVERHCRICHLGLEGGGPDSAYGGVPIDLGCSCKGDLGAAHKHCAETWFKIKGDTTCEICGVTAFNIASEQTNEVNGIAATAPSVPATPMFLMEARSMRRGRRIMNFLLACMILAFAVLWLFHFKVL